MDYHRDLLKASNWKDWFGTETDENQKVPPPPFQKPAAEGAVIIDLPPASSIKAGKSTTVFDAIQNRKSRRKYTGESLSLEELSFLLWATQSIRQLLRNDTLTRRTVPSGGSRHPFETYLFIQHVDGLATGLYRYLPLEHQLLFIYQEDQLAEKVNAAFNGQYIKDCAVAFMWTAIPYRTEWRYTIVSAKIILQDTGHLCQNLYLACEAIGAGTCAIGAYDQEAMDELLGVDGTDEFAIYAAPVGKV